VANLLRLRRGQPALRRRRFFDGRPIDPEEPLRDVHWLSPDGREMDGEDWGDAGRQVFGMQIGNDAEIGDRLLLLFNAGPEPCSFRIAPVVGGPWRPVFDTAEETGTVPPGAAQAVAAGEAVRLAGRSIRALAADGTAPRFVPG
jgi:isoamylase